jgi:hypothetical protein
MLPEEGSRQEFKAATHAQLAKYGIWDTQDKCWMGNDEGPLVYTEEWMARAALTILSEQFRTTRFRKKMFWEDYVVLKDEVKPLMSAVEAIRQIEGSNDGS